MTVIAGGSRCSSQYFAWHLMRTDRGQTVAIRDVVGLMGDDINEWFEQMEVLAEGGRTKNFFYHFSVSPRRGEAFTPEQVHIAVSTALENLGLEDQPYFVVEHGGKDGRPDHYHCIALRVDLDTGKAISDSNNYAIHMRTADELEELFGHEHTERGRGPDGPNPKNYEVQRGQETGIAPRDVAVDVRDLWRQADSGPAFAAALEEHGFILAEGDRGLCIVDPAGDEHSLYRRLGVKKKEVDARLEAIDRDTLPSVPDAKELAREHAEERNKRAENRDGADPSDRKHGGRLEGLVEGIAEALAETFEREKPRAEGSAPGEPESESTDYGPGPLDDAPPHQANTGPESSAARSASAPQPEAAPSGSLFERFAAKLSQAKEWLSDGPTVAEVADLTKRSGPAPEVPPALPWENTPPFDAKATTAAASALTAFDWLAQDMVPAAKDAAPGVPEHAPLAAPAVEREPSAFERFTEARFAASREAEGDGELFAQGLAWLARKVNISADAPIPGQEPTAFQRFTGELHQACRNNGGEPEPGFWQRGVAALRATRDRFLDWARESGQSFIGLVTRNRNTDHDKTGFDR